MPLGAHLSDSAESKNTYFARAVSKIIRRLARILLEQGVAYGTFEEWCRKSFVEAAEAQIVAQQQKVTTSNISALTGINRKETKRLREIGAAEDMIDTGARYNRAIRIISGWCTDADFLTEAGEPAILNLTGDGDQTFPNLVKRYSGDMSPTAMLDMLKNAGSAILINDKVKLVKTAYVPAGDQGNLDIINILGNDTAALIHTIAHNLAADESDTRHYQRKLHNTGLKSEYVDEFKQMSAEKSQALLVELNDWINARKAKSKDEPHEYVSLSIFFSDYQPPS